MSNLSLGNTLEEKRLTYAALTKTSKKWGKVFGILGIIFGIGIGALLVGSLENVFVGLLLFAIMLIGCPLGYYWYGQIVFYGYLVMRSFFSENKISGAAAAGAVGTSFLVSYLLGGKKAAKKTGIVWIAILMFSLTIGILVGFYYYIKFYMEAKKLGLKDNEQLPNATSYSEESKASESKNKEQSPKIENHNVETENENKKFCSNCGTKLEDGAIFCSNCGTKVNGGQPPNQTNQNSTATVNGQTYHSAPKCTHCGNIDEWKVGPLFRSLDYVVGVILLFFGFVPGLVYLGVVGLIRSNKDNREKICKKCGAKNMFTNIY